ncbi:MAG: hypothetical protein E6I26_06585 [Chloroflexi bacterium]|nr:MAG: hypothetical protein E6I26_06585 [Chloroflexota bacterium]
MIDQPDRPPDLADDGDGEIPVGDEAVGVGVSAAGMGDESGPSSADYSVAFTPRQVAVGFAILAGLVALAISRRRRKRSGGD